MSHNGPTIMWETELLNAFEFNEFTYFLLSGNFAVDDEFPV